MVQIKEFDARMAIIDTKVLKISDLHGVATACLETGFRQEAEEYAHECKILQASVDFELDALERDFPCLLD